MPISFSNEFFARVVGHLSGTDANVPRRSVSVNP
jgi:hypothetical protein